MIKRIVRYVLIATLVAVVTTIVGAPLSRAYLVADETWATEIAIFFITLDLIILPAACINIIYSDPREIG